MNTVLMVGASGPVRCPHPIRASGKSVKDDSSPIRASEQEKEIQGGMVGKRRKKNEAPMLVAGVMQTSDPRRPALGSKMTVT